MKKHFDAYYKNYVVVEVCGNFYKVHKKTGERFQYCPFNSINDEYPLTLNLKTHDNIPSNHRQ